MKGGKNKSKADVDEFDEFDDLVVPKSKKPPANKAKGTFTSARRGPPIRTPAAAPARGRGRGLRGRPPKKGNNFFSAYLL